jgi:ParB-like chromosome segregation protein Spo0J
MLIGEYETHPAADVFSLLEGAEFDALCEDIREHGLREPITRMRVKGKRVVLDGRNRLRACQVARVKAEWRDYDGEAGGVVAFVLSANLHRRHLDESQRAMAAARLATLPKGANQHASFEAPSQERAAELLNVDRSSVQRARRVQERGTADVIAAVERGALDVRRRWSFAPMNASRP